LLAVIRQHSTETGRRGGVLVTGGRHHRDISKKYALQVVGLLGAHGPTCYGELEDRIGATSSSLLSERLDELAEKGLIERRSFDEMPPRVEYSLTPRGRELETRIQPLLEWAAEEE
jgi:DNA-binding HxlR family transcriptional regulator